MRVGRIILVGGLAFFFFAVLIGGCTLYGSYTTAISLDEAVKTAWGDIETDLQRRYDLVPNIVESVKGYAQHEKGLLETIAKTRERYFTAATPGDKATAAGGFGEVMSRLLVLQEKYPDLKANSNFRDLMVTLEGTENRIAEKRRRYNEAVMKLNTHVRGPIGSIAASWAGVTPARRFEAAETARTAPKVEFTDTSSKP
ncbi:MAG: LemA family protein [Phycisphaerae bacterium]|nr:LemA family protein [Phycisphaerae bacterium]